jgi:hypothetical protein
MVSLSIYRHSPCLLLWSAAPAAAKLERSHAQLDGAEEGAVGKRACGGDGRIRLVCAAARRAELFSPCVGRA